MDGMKNVLAGLVLMVVVSTVRAEQPPSVVRETRAEPPTVRELVGRLTAHGVSSEAIERHFGKRMRELGDTDIPRLQQGLERLRTKQVQSTGAQSDSGDGSEFSQEKRQVRANIELWENRVRIKLQQVDRVVEGIDLRQIQAQKMAVDSLLDVLNQLDEEARSIIAAHQQVQPDLKLYRDALLKAPAVFRKIAGDLEKRATDRKAGLIKSGYADFAAEARKLASKYESQAAGIGGLEADLVTKIAVVHESREFIADVRELLKAIPTSHGIETEKFISRLNVYISVLQQAIDTMKGAAAKIGEPRSPTPEEPKPVPLAESNGSGSAVGEDRQRVGA